jgi:hypothetical protein
MRVIITIAWAITPHAADYGCVTFPRCARYAGE